MPLENAASSDTDLAGLLDDALAQLGCPLCRVSRLAEDALTAHADAAGHYCEAHLRSLLERHEACTGVTLALVAVDRLLDRQQTRSCVVCGRLVDIAGRILVALGEGVDDGSHADAYACSDGLCRYHLELAGALDVPGARSLADDGRLRLRRLRHRLAGLQCCYAVDGVGDRSWVDGVRALQDVPARVALPSRWLA